MTSIEPTDHASLTRAQFLKGGALGALSAALTGCSWTPRNAQVPQDEASGDSAGATDISEASTAGDAQPVTQVDDDLILIEGGTFVMGSPEDEPWRSDDEVQHEVAVGDFYLSPLEVSQSEFDRLMGRTDGSADADVPAANLSWYDAASFCNALSDQAGLTPAYAIDGQSVTWDLGADGYRLPTEAEWEYACRAGTTGPFNLDHSPGAEEANFYGHYPYEIEGNYFDQDVLETKPGVYRGEPIASGTFEPNAWGLYDMHGNVAEWVWDRYGAYDANAPQNPTGPDEGSLRVNRGGGWNDFAKNMRSAYRASMTPTSTSPSVGLRVARNAGQRTGTVGGSDATDGMDGGKALVAFFSWSGNTRTIATELASQLGVEATELVCADPYSADYNTCLDEAQRDQSIQARPALATTIQDMEQYGTVYLGYPNWWASIPMPIATFLESYDFAGKTIRPFCSNGGGGLGQSVAAISKLVPDARVGQGLSIYYSGGSDMPDQVRTWLEESR